MVINVSNKLMKKNIGIVGATGFVGEELVSLVNSRDDLALTFVSSVNSKGKKLSEVFPKIPIQEDLIIKSVDSVPNDLNFIFFATKHDFSMDYVPGILDKGIKVIDLSADFRLSNQEIWKEAYDTPHRAPALLDKSVYGLPEYFQKEIKTADLVAVPGCYPTASILGLLPLINKTKKDSSIIIDAKSGISGAGRSSVESSLEKDMKNNFKAYKTDFHRHTPEIKDFFYNIFKIQNEIIFIPHLIPIFRGEYITAYVEVIEKELNLVEIYNDYYAGHESIRIKPKGEVPQISEVINTNFCDISVGYAYQSNKVIINSAIDNLIKGAAGQAIQCLDIMLNVE